MNNESSVNPLRIITYFAIALLIVVFFIWFIPSKAFPVSWDLRNNLWGPTYLLWHHQSAYEIINLFPDSNAIWFPQIIGLFFPLGLLPQYQASNLWLSSNIVLLISLLWYLIWQVINEKPPLFLFFILSLAVFIFPPTIRHLILGQVDIVFVIAIIAGTLALEKCHLIISGFFYAIALVKPQLCLILLPSLIGDMLLIKREWGKTLKLFIMICSFSLILTIPLWISNPNWFKDFLVNLYRNPQWSQPSILSQLWILIGPSAIVLWFLLFIFIFKISFLLWTKFEPIHAASWCLALTTIVSPYIWSWDFILLLPLFIDTSTRLENRISRVTLFIFYIFCLLFSVASLQSTIRSDDGVLWWFPIVLILGMILSLEINKKPRKNILDDFGHISRL